MNEHVPCKGQMDANNNVLRVITPSKLCITKLESMANRRDFAHESTANCPIGAANLTIDSKENIIYADQHTNNAHWRCKFEDESSMQFSSQSTSFYLKSGISTFSLNLKRENDVNQQQQQQSKRFQDTRVQHRHSRRYKNGSTHSNAVKREKIQWKKIPLGECKHMLAECLHENPLYNLEKKILPKYTVSVIVNGRKYYGNGPTWKTAQSKAAKAALKWL